MAARTTEAGSTRGRFAVAAAFACLAAGVVAIGASTPADAVNAKEIGKTRKTPDPSCPSPSGNDFPQRKACEALGKVTAFQKVGDGKKKLMRMPRNGKIVAWAVDLAKPNKSERNFFESALDGAPSARIAFLTAASGTKYRLRAQGPATKLNGLMGRRQYFTLRNPISVKEGWIAALTTPTWVPNFAHNLKGKGKDNVWKASRTRERCGVPPVSNLTERSKPHKKVGSTRAYGCTYKDGRVLYWVYFVANNA